MAKRIQGSEEAEALDDLPDDADRALSIVRNKLDARLSVQYTVNQVIQEATDPRNLSSIFSGTLSFSSSMLFLSTDPIVFFRMATLLLDTPFTAFFPLVPHSKTRFRSLPAVAMSFYLSSRALWIVGFSGELENGAEFEKKTR